MPGEENRSATPATASPSRWRQVLWLKGRASFLLLILLPLSLAVWLAHALRLSGTDIRDKRRNLRLNNLWISLRWLGVDEWFRRYGRDPTPFNDPPGVKCFLDRAAGVHPYDLFPASLSRHPSAAYE